MNSQRNGIGVALIGAVAMVALCSIADGAGICGPDNSNDCCLIEDNDTPGCNDEACCALICNIDPFCCEVQWSEGCGFQALDLCEVCSGGGGEGPPIGCEDDTDCDDLDPCTIDSCDVDTGQCSNEEFDCDDADQCTADFCEGGECQHTDNGECCDGCGTCAGDVNCSGDVDPLDSGSILARFGLDPCNEENCKYDVNCDGAIDPLDSGFVLARFGQCNTPEVCKICEGPVCGPGAGDCCVDNGTPGCDDEACCELVCGFDPFCCDASWDSTCAAEAIAVCEHCSGVGVCGPDNSNECCLVEDNDTPGCNDEACCTLICEIDPWCCDVAWSEGCAVQAKGACEVCAVP